MEKNKKETSNIIIYLCILLLVAIIATPPLLRTFLPKDDIIKNENNTQEKIELLTCNKKSDDSLSQMNIKTKFKNGEANTVTISYSISSTAPSEQTPTDNTPNTESPSTVPSENKEEGTNQTYKVADPALDVFRALKDATVTETAEKFAVTMTQKTLASNQEVEGIHNYFNLLPNQKKYYEELGYTCTKLET